ncbi:MAG: hypothetical protein JWP31_2342 [Aeromicrobium sp.]|nr:hypothetical protein [Aeromicrobium sp.]
MTDTATARRSRRPWIIGAVVLVVVILMIVAVIIAGSKSANGAADNYEDDFAAWQKKQTPVLLAAARSVPAGTYVLKRQSEKKQLARQAKGCDKIESSIDRIAAARKSLPTLGGNTFGALSSSFGDASDQSETREKIVDDYVEAATATLEQLQRDCRWNIAFNSASTESSKLYETSQKYLLKAGGVEPGATCPGKVDCISSITKKKNTYADLQIKAQKSYTAKAKKLWGDECAKTSLGSMCSTFSKASDDYAAASLRSSRYIRSTASTIDNMTIRKNSAALQKVGKRNDVRILKALKKELPDLRIDKKLKASPGYTDLLFPRVAKMLLADLSTKRAALKKL